MVDIVYVVAVYLCLVLVMVLGMVAWFWWRDKVYEAWEWVKEIEDKAWWGVWDAVLGKHEDDQGNG
jgi:uncharacterized iron-regulated membrane protein